MSIIREGYWCLACILTYSSARKNSHCPGLLVPGMRIDLFTGTEVSERPVHARLAVCVPDVPDVKCAQSDNLVSSPQY